MAPGQGATGVGTLTASGIAFQPGGRLAVDLNGDAAYDRLKVNGAVSLNGAALQVGLGYLPALNTVFTVVENDGTDAVSGTFAGLSEGGLMSQGGGTFRVNYTGGTGNDVILTLIDLNHAPTLTTAQPSLGTTNEDTPKTINLNSFINTGPGTTTIGDIDANTVLGGVALTGTTGRGSWSYSLDGVTFTSVGSVSDSQALLLGASTQLRYQPDSKNGETATITFRAWDKSNGVAGVKVDATRNGIASPFSANTDTASLTVTDVDDAPTLISSSTLISLNATDENTASGPKLVSSLLSDAGYADVDAGASSGIAVTGQSGNGVWQYSADGATWANIGSVSNTAAMLLNSSMALRYVPNGTTGETATLTFRAWDQTTGGNGSNTDTSGSQSGGQTAFSTVSRTARISVTYLNDAPTAMDGTTSTNEDTAATIDLRNQVDDLETAKSSLIYTIVPGSVVNGTIASTTTTGVFSFIPTANFNGPAGFSFYVTDNGDPAGSNLNPGPLSSATKSVSITVTAVNDAPTVATTLGSVSVLEDASVSTIPLAGVFADVDIATNGDALAYSVSSSNPGLVTAAIDSGQVVLTYLGDQNGAATITVTATDTANAAVPTSFGVTVTAVNDAPTFAAGANQTVLEDAGLVTVAGWATSISAGPAEGAGQALNFLVTGNTNPGLFSTAPAIDPSGKLTFIPAPNANGTATVTVRLHDNGGIVDGGVDTSAAQTFTITVNAVADAPTLTLASASGNEAAAIPLAIAAALTDSDGSESLSIRIDGVPASATLSAGTRNVDASWTLSPAQLSGLKITSPDNASFDLTVSAISTEVSNGSTATTTGSLRVTVANVIPTVMISGPGTGVAGQSRHFAGSFADPGGDSWAATVKYGDGTGTFPLALNPDRTFAFNHTYTSLGTFTVTVTVTDDDAGSGSTSSTIQIRTIDIQPDPSGNGQALVVGGSTGSDIIDVRPGFRPGQIIVSVVSPTTTGVAATVGIYSPTTTGGELSLSFGGASLGIFAAPLPADLDRIIAYGQAGNDNIRVTGLADLGTILYGDAGNDDLYAGGGSSILLGGAGDDTLTGGLARDLLIGGTGADQLIGSVGDDILIAGFTAYDLNELALTQILSEWNSTRSYATRVANLKGTGSGPRNNGNTFLFTDGTSATVFDDGVVDVLIGSAGQDWFLFNVDGDGNKNKKDKATDLVNSEIGSDIDQV